ncbi:MAG: phospholipase D-like domain-containing protein [Candidatus Helarchaeota archaeon]
MLSDINEILKFILNCFKENNKINLTLLKKSIAPEIAQSALLKFTIDHLVKEGAFAQKIIKNDIFLILNDIEVLNNFISNSEKKIKKNKANKLKDYFIEIEKKEHLPITQINLNLNELNKFKTEDYEVNKELNEKIEIWMIYSIPFSKIGDINNIKRRYNNLKIYELGEIIKFLLKNAQKEVLISSPFLDSEGIIFIIEELKRLARKRITLKILTRVFSRRNQLLSEWKYIQKLASLRNIFQIFRGEGAEGLFEVKDYELIINPTAFNVNLYSEGFHQKMIIIDHNLCYLGSGELTLASLRFNGECGILLKGKSIEFWRDFFYIFWNSNDAKKVTEKEINLLLT